MQNNVLTIWNNLFECTSWLGIQAITFDQLLTNSQTRGPKRWARLEPKNHKLKKNILVPRFFTLLSDNKSSHFSFSFIHLQQSALYSTAVSFKHCYWRKEWWQDKNCWKTPIFAFSRNFKAKNLSAFLSLQAFGCRTCQNGAKVQGQSIKKYVEIHNAFDENVDDLQMHVKIRLNQSENPA